MVHFKDKPSEQLKGLHMTDLAEAWWSSMGTGDWSALAEISNGNIVIGMVINQVYREAARSVVYFTYHKTAEARILYSYLYFE